MAVDVDYTVVGTSVPRLDGLKKVTGRPIYTGDIELPGMLHGAILRSTYPHARVVRVDKTRAERVPGVVAVVSGADVANTPGIDPWYGPVFRDQAILAIDKVRYIGDPVAAVVAADRESAEEALELIEVEYEPLPAVFDPVEAAQPGAPLVHEVLKPARAFADMAHVAAVGGTNVCYHQKVRKGDVEAAFARADYIFEDTYTSPPAQHAPLEPHVTLVYIDEDDRINIWTATQSPSFIRTDIAAIFRVPLNRVRVMVPYLGAGYGSKLYDKLEPLTAYLAYITRKPVRIALSRPEEFLTITKHAVVARCKMGVMKNGDIIACETENYWNTGAYADIGPRVVHKSGYTSAGPYKFPNVKIDAYCVYTNNVPAGAFRGFGVPQIVWAYESQMDVVAHNLGIDPLELRLRHALDEGDEFATGTPMISIGVKQSLRQVAEAIGWDPPRPPRRVYPGSGPLRGKGLACGVKAVLTPSISGAVVHMNADGSVTVLSSTVEMGQGSETALAQIAAEELGVPIQKVRVHLPDTDVTPYDTITAGSRSTYHMGNAIRRAAGQIKQQLFEAAAEVLEANPEDLVLRNERIFVRGAEERGLTIPEVFAVKLGALGTNLVGEATYKTIAEPLDHETGQSKKSTEFWFSGATAAEVEVDPETGQVRVLKLVAAADVGKEVNPHHCVQQIEGAAILTLGLTFFEWMNVDQGQVTNASFLDYQLPSLKDVPPEIVALSVTVPHPDGPYGAKGVGESGTLSVQAAIGNAIYNAVGVRVKDLPITPEKILRALRAAEQS
ncbi:MAG TPA: xanthine dehydrogenase family protein molybdopterin-binding subunit [Chloroflexota bacterium]|nr:xanthine dehydrogenase family protein molybdopterin-binding subunit [Chloroflexota bacterium]